MGRKRRVVQFMQRMSVLYLAKQAACRLGAREDVGQKLRWIGRAHWHWSNSLQSLWRGGAQPLLRTDMCQAGAHGGGAVTALGDSGEWGIWGWNVG